VTPVILFAPSGNQPVDQFLVGKNPSSLKSSSPTSVPCFPKASKDSFVASLSFILPAKTLNPSLSTGRLPSFFLTAIAFKFLEPITAPVPFLPLALLHILIIQAYLTRFSPPGPI
jgi:hypothetical protein